MNSFITFVLKQTNLLYFDLLFAENIFLGISYDTTQLEFKNKFFGFSRVYNLYLVLFFNIPSILSMTSAVNLGTTSKAFIFSRTCSGLLAPVITVETLGFLRHYTTKRQKILFRFSKSKNKSLTNCN